MRHAGACLSGARLLLLPRELTRLRRSRPYASPGGSL
ncbi:hypothetical protein SFR_6840 [Streptomyces sp. FR-008]|nr:hypothetical protein SFR_6840 [Streptomyces sp. FR-008]